MGLPENIKNTLEDIGTQAAILQDLTSMLRSEVVAICTSKQNEPASLSIVVNERAEALTKALDKFWDDLRDAP